MELYQQQNLMHPYYMMPPGYPMIEGKIPIDPSYYSMQKLMDIINAQAYIIRRVQRQVDELKNEVLGLNERFQQFEGSHKSASPQSEENNQGKQSQGKIRRKNFKNKFSCPYQQCDKSYGSSLALNLHIKQKHNGGTKKQRQAYAKIIFTCQQKGVAAPLIECDFPPGFLQQQRKKYHKKTSYYKAERIQ